MSPSPAQQAALDAAAQALAQLLAEVQAPLNRIIGQMVTDYDVLAAGMQAIIDRIGADTEPEFQAIYAAFLQVTKRLSAIANQQLLTAWEPVRVIAGRVLSDTNSHIAHLGKAWPS